MRQTNILLLLLTRELCGFCDGFASLSYLPAGDAVQGVTAASRWRLRDADGLMEVPE
jgi:hypothetical protein